MPETFPVAFGSIRLRPRSNIAFAGREKSKLLIVSRTGDGIWAGTLTTGTLLQGEYADFVAFCQHVVENNLRVDFIHPRFARPRAYAAGAWPVVTPTVADVVDGFTLSVAGLDNGIQLLRGDRLAINQTDLPPCYRELAADVLVASETAQEIKVSSRLPIGAIAAEASVDFINPAVRLAIVPDSLDGLEEYRPVPVTIQVEEDGL